MNQAQLKYAKERAATIFKAREQALRASFTTEAVILTMGEKLKRLRGHRGFVVLDEPNGSKFSLCSYVKFPDERPSVFDSEGFTAAYAALKDTYTKLTDELVLGDNEQALKLLREFANA